MNCRTAVLRTLLLLLIPLLLTAPASLSASGPGHAEPLDEPAGLTVDKELPLPPDLTLTLTPHNPPVVIPASGGTFQYAVDVRNNWTAQATFDVWTSIATPDGAKVAAAGPFRIRLPGEWSASRDDLTQAILPADPPGNYTYLAYAGRYPDRILVSASFTFEKLSGGGWFPQSSGTSDWLFAIHFADANNGWAVGQTNEIVHTSNGGDVWTAQTTPVFANLWTVFAADGQNAWAGGSGAVLIHTGDGGASWVQQATGQPATTNWQGLYFLDSNNGWAVGGKPVDFTAPRRVIVHTSDGGGSWQTQYSQSSETPLNAVHFVDANNGWAVGDGGGILHTSNGGATWVQQTSGVTIHLADVHFADASNGWAVGWAGTLIQTSDGGATWVWQDLGGSNDLTSIHFADASNGWIAGIDQSSSQAIILHTDDGGATWHNQDPGPATILYGLIFADANNGWAVGDNGTIIHTDTGGE